MATLCACDLDNVVRLDPYRISAQLVRAAMDAYADRLIVVGRESVPHTRRDWMKVQAEVYLRAGNSPAMSIAQAKADDRAAYPRVR